MFSLKRILRNNSFTSLISQETVVRGAIDFDDGILKIEGNVFANSPNDSIRGNLNTDTTIHLVKGSRVNVAEISAGSVIIDSANVVTDSIRAEKHLHIGKNAVLENLSILCRSIFIEPGATMHGTTINNLDQSSAGEQQ